MSLSTEEMRCNLNITKELVTTVKKVILVHLKVALQYAVAKSEHEKQCAYKGEVAWKTIALVEKT